MKSASFLGAAVAVLLPSAVVGCGGDVDCYGNNQVEYVRQVKRMQPGAPNASYNPTSPLQWGQINFLHTVRCPREVVRRVRRERQRQWKMARRERRQRKTTRRD